MNEFNEMGFGSDENSADERKDEIFEKGWVRDKGTVPTGYTE
jgi:hypothetical protein